MEVTVRPAALDDRAEDLLYLSAERYYDAYAGDEATARRLLRRVHPKPGHPASVSLARVAEAEGRVVGVIVGFPAGEGEDLARHFLRLTAWRIPPWRWRRSGRATSTRPPVCRPRRRRARGTSTRWRSRRTRGARASPARCSPTPRRPRAPRARPGSRSTPGSRTSPACALYEASGFEQRDVRRARDERAAAALGGAGVRRLLQGPVVPSRSRSIRPGAGACRSSDLGSSSTPRSRPAACRAPRARRRRRSAPRGRAARATPRTPSGARRRARRARR